MAADADSSVEAKTTREGMTLPGLALPARAFAVSAWRMIFSMAPLSRFSDALGM
jgi:hypothetical protein